MDELISKDYKNACSICGVLRRRCLNIVAIDQGANKIATAHTLDDEAQTFLQNIFDSNIENISSQVPIQSRLHNRLIPRIKPLRNITTREVVLYNYFNNIN